MAKQIIIGLFVIGAGGVVVYFSAYIADIFGTIDWFERNLGGTRNGLILFGFGIILIGLLILFGVIPTTSPTEQISTLSTAPATQ